MLLSPMFFANPAIRLDLPCHLRRISPNLRATPSADTRRAHALRRIATSHNSAIAPQSGVSNSPKTRACMRNYPQKHLELMRLNPTGMNTRAKRAAGWAVGFQALIGVSTRAGSRKLRPRRSGPKATAMPNITMVKISNPARAQP